MSHHSKSHNAGTVLPPLDVSGNNKITGQKPQPPTYIQEAAKSISASPSPTSSQTSHENKQMSKSDDSPSPVTVVDGKIQPVPPPPPPPSKAVRPPPSSSQSVAPPIAPGASATMDVPPPSLQAVVLQPPSISKELSNAQSEHSVKLENPGAQADKEQNADRSSVENRMTDAYVQQWSPLQDDIEKTSEDVKFVIHSLKSVDPTLLLFKSTELAPRFTLLCRAVMSPGLSDDFKEKVLHVFLNNEWSSFLAAHLKIFQDVETWDTRFVITAAANLVKGLEILRQPIRHLSAQVSGQIFNHHFTTVFDGLQDPMMIKSRSDSHKSPAYKVLSALISTLQDFVLVDVVRDEKMTTDSKAQVKALCTEYLEALEEGSVLSSMCNRALDFLEEDKSPFPQLPINYLNSAKGTEENLESHIENIEYVVKRLASVSMEDHMALPWKYQYDFSFMLSVMPTKSGLSSESANRVMAAVFKDGLWQKTIIDLYTAVLINNDNLTPSNMRTKCVLVNIRNGLLTMVNGTDICKDKQLLQQTFDQFVDFLIEQLKSKLLRTALMEMGKKDNLNEYFATSMITIIHNFSYYHEPAVSVLREKGMISIARDIRKECEDSDVKTSCLLVIAYLMNESDDKKMMKITDDELSFLTEELSKSMLSRRASDYHPEELIDGLNRIAVSDINKLKLIECGVLKLLTKSLDPKKNYTPAHVASAIKGIWNLSFSEESRKEIMEVKGLMEALRSLRDSEHDEIQAAAAGALWQLEGKDKHIADAASSEPSKNQKRHIMFSYNHQAKEEVHKMKDRLKQMGYKVWIDTEQIAAGASTLEAMSNAIEESCLVLIFFSEPYKNSVNCRAEAEYVFERQKPFLPVQVQAGYKPDGWLGILFGSKYRYTLSKPDKYESEVSGLMSKVTELTSGQSASIDVVDAPIVSTAAPTFTSTPSVYQKAKLECESWSCDQVQEWVKENGLDKYMESLAEMDGEMLGELVRLSCDHKGVFYTVISKTEGIGLMGILRFNKAVQKLVNM